MSLEISIFRSRLPVTELPDERMQFTLGMYGDGDFYHHEGRRRRIPGQSRNEKETGV